MDWNAIQEWFLGLGAEYGVDPVIFGAIYVGAIPFFIASVAWIGYNVKRGKSIALPVMAAALCAMSAYIYLFIAGENLPHWVYAAVAALLAYGAWTTYRKVRRRVRQDPPASSSS
jgi:CHASE2 domain-containing sensor protein